MAPLSPKAQALLQSGREGLRPTDAERARIEAALDAHAALPSKVPPVRVNRWRLLAPLAVGVALIGGGAAFLLLRSERQLPLPPASVPSGSPGASATVPFASATATALQAAPTSDASAVAPPLTPSATAPAIAPPVSGHVPDGLSQEIALLSRAASALRAGRAAEALQLTNEYQRRFPNGVLGVERRAVRAQALCSLKRVTEGRAELAHLPLQSPAAARAKQICDAASDAPDR